jgi:hypothetical protein
MSLFTAALVGLFAMLLFVGFAFLLQKASEKYKSLLKILLALIVIGYTWIPFDSSTLFYSIVINVFGVYVIQNEYQLLKKITSKSQA